MTAHRSSDRDFDTLFHKDEYTIDEVAYLLDRSPSNIASAVWNHQLWANLAGHDIVSITRHDLLDWLNSPGHEGQPQ